jgi:hypothetical protein
MLRAAWVLGLFTAPAACAACEDEIPPDPVRKHGVGIGVSEGFAQCGTSTDRARLQTGQDDAEARAWCRGTAKVTRGAAGAGHHHIAAPQRCLCQGGQLLVGSCLRTGMVVAIPVHEPGAAVGDAGGDTNPAAISGMEGIAGVERTEPQQVRTVPVSAPTGGSATRVAHGGGYPGLG